MPRSAGLVAASVVLLLAGAVCLAAGVFERRMAIAQEDAAVLEFNGPMADYAELEARAARVPFVGELALQDIHRRRAAIQYWQGDYADLASLARQASADGVEPPAVDPELQALAANALFRLAQRGTQDRATLVRNLDAAIRAYADALRAGGRQDMAYNYELAVRLRDAVNAGKVKSLAPASTDDSESEPNMHGDPGEPPKELRVEQFQIRVPMDPKEVKQSQDQAAGTGQARRKRG